MRPILLFPFLRRGNWGTERVKSLPEATQPPGCECRPTWHRNLPLRPGVVGVVPAHPGGKDRECHPKPWKRSLGWSMGRCLFGKNPGGSTVFKFAEQYPKRRHKLTDPDGKPSWCFRSGPRGKASYPGTQLIPV